MNHRTIRRRSTFLLEQLETRHLLTAAPVAVADTFELQEDESLVLTPQLQPLVMTGEVWRYLDDGSDQGTAWRAPSFNDSGWDSGPSQLGYGDGDEATEVGFGPDEDNKYPTTYFRRSFDVPASLDVSGLQLELLFDDGAAVYLNGVEVVRDNLPPNAAYNSYASSVSDNEESHVDFTVDPSLLVEGTNVLAVEVHQSDATSSDVSFDLRLTAVVGRVGVLANDTDADGDPLTAQLVDPPQHGALSFNSDGTFSYLPDPNFFGTDTFTYRANDGGLDSNIATVTLNIASVNDVPQAGANHYHSLSGVTLEVAAENGVLVDDFDFEEQPLTAVLVEDVQHGTLVLNDDGSFSYTPDPGFEGTDTFRYAASDGSDASPAATVSLLVTLANEAPVTVADQYVVDEDDVLEVTFAIIPEPVEVFFTNFDDGIPSQFSGVRQSAGVEGLAGRGTQGNVFGGSFLRNAENPLQNGPGPSTVLTLTDLPPHTNVSLGFLLAQLDQWDGNQSFFGGQFQIPDRFNVRVDGELVFSETFDSTDDNQTYDPPDGGRIVHDQNLWSGGNNEESAYDMYLEPSLQKIPHSSPTLTIELFADGAGYRRQNFGGGGREPESWAIDNFSVVLGREPVQQVVREDLIAAGSPWRYLDNGSDQGTAWRAVDFDDSQWHEGPGELGYGDGDEATEINFGPDADNKYPTTYFRRTFDVTDAGSITELILELKRDDGALVYINGIEVVQDNVESGAAYDSYAQTVTQTEDAFLVHQIDPSVLVDGENVIAVEVHQSDAESSDMSFDLSLSVRKDGGEVGASSFGVLQNDSDPEEGMLAAEVVTQPGHGTLQFHSDGTFTYTPVPNYHGSDTFTYRARDSFGATTEGTVTITVIPGPNEPPLILDKSYSTDEDTPLVVGGGTGLLAGATDEDGDTLHAVLHTPPQHGSVAITNSGSFQYTPDANFFGTDTFQYIANDSLNDSDPATVTITVHPVADAPIGTHDLYFVYPGDTLTVAVEDGILQNDVDGDGDTISAVLVADVSFGSLSLASTGAFVYVPDAGFEGEDSFTYRATDSGLNSDVTTVTIRVDAPPVANANTYALSEDVPLSVAAAQGVLANDTDRENDPLTATLATGPLHGQLTLNPNGSFTYTPSLNFFGTDSFTYLANDGDQDSEIATVTLNITPVNDAPLAAGDSYGVVPDGVLTIEASNGLLANDSDVDSANLTAALVPETGPSHGVLSLNTDGSFTYTPNAGFQGTDTFTYRTSDGALTSVPATVVIDVSDPTEVMITEIMYNLIAAEGSDEFIELYNSGIGAINLEGWRITQGVDFEFPAVFLGPGEYLVVAANPTRFATLFPNVTATVVGGWTGRLSNSGEDLQIETADGLVVDRVDYADEGDWAVRRASGIGGWQWQASTDGGGRSLELINLAADNERGQNWAPSTTITGTPGSVNSVASSSTAPFIYDVEHSPAVPQPGEQVTVTANLTDDQDAPMAASVFYRVATASPGPFLETEMFDDGLHHDGMAGDGVFGAILPPQADGTVVEFYVRASDAQSNSRTWPAPTDTAGTQGANALYQVDTEAYDGHQPIYRLILTPAELQPLLGADRQSDAQRNATFINFDGTGYDIRYLTGVRFRGNGSRFSGNLANYRINFPSDNPWQGVDAINMNSQYPHGQLLGMTLFELSGLLQEDAMGVQLRLNGTQYATSPVQQGSYVRLEVTNSDWVDNHLPNDPNANVYRGTNAELTYNGTNPGQYSNGYNKQTNSAENNWNDLIALTRALSAAQTPDNVFTQTLEQVADVDQWMRFLAANALLVNEENGLINGNGDDFSLVCGVVDPRCRLLVHDLDSIFAEGDNDAQSGRIDRSLFEPRNLEVFNRILNVPEYLDLYYYHLRDLATTVFAPENLFPVMDNLLGDWVNPTILQEMKEFAEGRVDWVLSQIPNNLNNLIPMATIDGEPMGVTTSDSVTLNVAGRGVATYEYRVNEGPWSARRAAAEPITLTNLADGSYTVEVVGYSANGVRQRTTDLTPPTRSQTWQVDSDYSQVVISEVLASNRTAFDHEGQFPDVIELYNRGTTSVNLAGMSITDDVTVPNRFVFPAGTTLAPGAHLVLLANGPDGTGGIHVGFSLDNDGEQISLFDAGGNLVDQVTFGIQLNDMSVSRDEHGQFGLSLPTLGAANQLAPLGDASELLINEWFADGDRLFNDDFIELYNPTGLPISLGGLYLTDAPAGWKDRHEITQLSYIGANSYQVMLADGNVELGAHHLNFSLNANREAIALYDDDLQRIDMIVVMPQTTDVSQGRNPDGAGHYAFFGLPTPGSANIDNPGAAAIVQRLRITELMYNPTGASQGTEFIELQNISDLPVDITGVRIDEGVTFTFPSMVLQPGAFVLVVNDRQEFESIYGTGLPIAGEFEGNLSNGGEEIALMLPAPLELDVLRFDYDDDPQLGWPATADGTGRSLVVRDTEGDYDEPGNWRASSAVGGTPGTDGFTVIGDFNSDGLLNMQDMDLLYAQIRSGVFVIGFDLTEDGRIDRADSDDWILNRKQTMLGDFNLDYAVDGSDWNIWFAHRFSSAMSRSQGDANADGWVDGSDFNLFNVSKFTVMPGRQQPAAASVPRAAGSLAADVPSDPLQVVNQVFAELPAIRRIQQAPSDEAMRTLRMASVAGSTTDADLPQRPRLPYAQQLREQTLSRRRQDPVVRTIVYQELQDEVFARW